jgi:hypothetical protein
LLFPTKVKPFCFEKRRSPPCAKQKTFVLLGALLWPACVAHAEEDGRDFPKTLIFDEPGIDDEVSLPTVLFVPQQGSRETDVDFELDKRLTTRLSLQINVGYTGLARIGESSAGGWQNSDATLKLVAYANRAMEQLVSFSLTREFGGSGARRIGAEGAGSTVAALNFGQGFAAVAEAPALKPFALTGVAGFLVPDSPVDGAVRQAVVSASLQYSLDVLAARDEDSHVPAFARPLIPVVEFAYAAPLGGNAASHATLAPGLIYSGEGYQVAAEALVPLTRATGTHIGAILQLNISLLMFGVPALTRPVF